MYAKLLILIRISLKFVPKGPVILTIRNNWFRYWLNAEQATSHYLNQCWPTLIARFRGHSLKLEKKYCRKSLRQNFFMYRVVQDWNCLPKDVISQPSHYNDVIMGAMASQITSLTLVYSTVYSGADQRKHQSSIEFPAQMASNAEKVSIWWRHHAYPVSKRGWDPCSSAKRDNPTKYTKYGKKWSLWNFTHCTAALLS